MGKMVYVRENKTKPGQPGYWKEAKKIEAVTTYLALGNLAETSRVINVPIPTLKDWKTQDWWKTYVEDIQSESNVATDKKISKIIDKALDLLVDRMDEGNYQYDQARGKLVKVPLNAQDLNKVATALFDKRQLIRKQPTSIKTNPENTEARLLKLAKEFAKFVGNKVPEERVVNDYIEGETVHVTEDGGYVFHPENDPEETNIESVHEVPAGETSDGV